MSGARPMTGVWGKVAFPQVSRLSIVASGASRSAEMVWVIVAVLLSGEITRSW